MTDETLVKIADAATREIHGDDYRIATRMVIERAIREALREAGQSKREAYEEAAMVCDKLWEKNNSFAYHFEIERIKQVQRAAVYRTCVEAIRKLGAGK